jgi:hypothetical protein
LWDVKILQNRKEKKKKIFELFLKNFVVERVDSTGVVTPLKTSRERTRSLYLRPTPPHRRKDLPLPAAGVGWGAGQQKKSRRRYLMKGGASISTYIHTHMLCPFIYIKRTVFDLIFLRK